MPARGSRPHLDHGTGDEGYNVVIDVTDPVSLDDKDHEVITLVDKFLKLHDENPIITVSNRGSGGSRSGGSPNRGIGDIQNCLSEQSCMSHMSGDRGYRIVYQNNPVCPICPSFWTWPPIPTTWQSRVRARSRYASHPEQSIATWLGHASAGRTAAYTDWTIIMQTLNRDTSAQFLRRFCSFNDAVIRRIEHHYAASGQKRTIVTLSARDQETDQGWSNVVIVIDGVSEIAFREGKATCQVLSSGLAVTWFRNNVWCDYSPSIEPKSIEEFRQSDFYIVGKCFEWQVQSYSDQ